MQEREAAGVLRDTAAIRTPFYVVDETLLKKNLEILKDTAERAGCRILLAQKAFSMYSVYPVHSLPAPKKRKIKPVSYMEVFLS